MTNAKLDEILKLFPESQADSDPTTRSIQLPDAARALEDKHFADSISAAIDAGFQQTLQEYISPTGRLPSKQQPNVQHIPPPGATKRPFKPRASMGFKTAGTVSGRMSTVEPPLQTLCYYCMFPKDQHDLEKFCPRGGGLYHEDMRYRAASDRLCVCGSDIGDHVGRVRKCPFASTSFVFQNPHRVPVDELDCVVRGKARP
jgi:hypothetical protein